jgi:hypothetical protein
MAIVSAATKVQATVEYITSPKTGQYGDYKSVLFKRCDRTGEDAKVWKSFSPADAAQFSIGQSVRLIPTERKGKATWDIELIESAQPTTPVSPTTPPAQQGMSPSQKKAVAAYVEEMGALYRFCLEQASEQLSEMDADSETIRCCASSLFISAQRKFNLA